MKAIIPSDALAKGLICRLPRALTVAGFLLAGLAVVRASSPVPPGAGGETGPTYTPLATWSFHDSANWTSDQGDSAISFTNLNFSPLGNGYSLVVDTNLPAWLNYRVYETNGLTNLTVDTGTVLFWFAPDWSGTNAGGTGPGDYGRLLEAGGCTADSSYGWWSLYVDPSGTTLNFSAQTNDLSGSYVNYFSVPIAWKTNYFHFIALTYSPTNTTLYLDGNLVTNGLPLTVYPGTNVLANGFWIGSDTNNDQAHGLFNHVQTYNVVVDGGTIQETFNQEYLYYMINPNNKAMFTLTNAPSNPAYDAGYSAISGAGNLQWAGAASVPYGADAYQVWLTNLTATVISNDTVNTTFTIAGGQDGYAYDVFASGNLESPLTNGIWVWLGQGNRGNTYTVAVTSHNAFLILGTPLDSDFDGLTDAYEALVSKTDPTQAQTDAYGVPYAWYVQNGIDPRTGGQDPDQDALLNYQEYFYGTKPQTSEGFAIWTAVN